MVYISLGNIFKKQKLQPIDIHLVDFPASWYQQYFSK